jgi:hypothetical protein
MAIKRPLIVRLVKKFLGKRISYEIHNLILSLYNINLFYKLRLYIFKSNITPKSLVVHEKKVLEELGLFGIAKSNIDNFFSSSFLYDSSIEDWFQTSQASYYFSENAKSYELKYSNRPDNLEINRHLIYLSTFFKPLADCYLGCNSKLFHYDLWHTIQSKSNQRIQSQNWHRDPEDRRILKIWIYLEGIFQENGAMEFINSTHNQGKHKNYFPSKFPFGKYLDEESLQNLMSQKTIAEGDKESVFFVDTTGFHRGGYLENGSRKMIHFIYTTPICPYQEVVPL